MITSQVAIVGGGLSGLHAAMLLEARGITDYVLLEARDAWGGRIASVPDDKGTAARYDLGATWFWPDMQPELHKLINELGISSFMQHEEGDILVERSTTSPPARFEGYVSSPPSWRLSGGMGALTAAIRARLQRGQCLSGQRVTHIALAGGQVELSSEDALGRVTAYRAAHVMLAVPPRLAAQTIAFTPGLPEALLSSWQSCATWMAPHAKYLAVFDIPFWRERGLSGGARSSVGPMVEIHDASPAADGAALFGFLGVPAQVRRQHPESTWVALCRAQLVRLFGKEAASPRAEFLKDWAIDPHTAVASDAHTDGHHPQSPPCTPTAGAWQGRLIGIASEWSPSFSGYAAGAIDAASRGVGLLTASATVTSGHVSLVRGSHDIRSPLTPSE